MRQLQMLARLLGEETGSIILNRSGDITQIRLRANRPLQISFLDGTCVERCAVNAEQLKRIVNTLMENSLYAWENELKQGYFTAAGGLRVGVCGRTNAGACGVEHLSSIASVCIRIPREVRGCADVLLQHAHKEKLESMLVLSPPGLGKTTVLREYIRNISELGWNVGVADERSEIAACMEGIPQLDVGCRTDVLDGCPKYLAIPMLVRSCAPDLIAVDEIGSMQDAAAVLDARNCGVAVIATAHAANMGEAGKRQALQMLLKNNVFRYCAVLGPEIGGIKSLIDCRNARFDDAEDCSAADHNALLHSSGADVVQCAPAARGITG